jgi:glycine reductase
MLANTLRVVHYLNQFFAGVGGEDKADVPAQIKNGFLGPGLAIQKSLGEHGEIVATVFCGDDYFSENQDRATEEIISLIAPLRPDLVIAGPAFNAGRYGVACSRVCEAVQEHLKAAAITAMHVENPGVEASDKKIYIVPTAATAIGMGAVVDSLVRLGCKLVEGTPIGSATAENYIPRGYRRNGFVKKTGAQRGVDMLLAKINGERFQTEIPLPSYDRVSPAEPVVDMSCAAIALVTEGGIVPKGNPDRIESKRASKWVKYSLKDLDELTPETHECVHGGFDTDPANQDPNRILPLDMARQLEKEGTFGKLYDEYFVTVGNSNTIDNAKKYGTEIAKELLAAGVKGVVFPAT